MPRMPSDRVVAHIAYDGTALKDGSMDVRELAPALLALGDLLQSANRLLNGNRASLEVKVQADFKTGSFDVGIALFQNLSSHVMTLLGSDGVKTAKEIADFVGLITGTPLSVFGPVGVFGLIKWLRGRKIESSTQNPDGTVEITVKVKSSSKGDRTVVRAEVYQMASDPDCRKAAEGVVKPLKVEGIDKFETRQGKQIVEQVTKDDLPAFEVPAPPAKELEPAPPTTQLVEIVKPSFDQDLTWTFSDGSAGGRFEAVMKDPVFLERVKAGEDFRIGDLLRVTIETKQSITTTGLRTRREVTDVHDQIKVPRQVPLLPPPVLPPPVLGVKKPERRMLPPPPRPRRDRKRR